MLELRDLNTFYGKSHILQGLPLTSTKARSSVSRTQRGRQKHDTEVDHGARGFSKGYHPFPGPRDTEYEARRHSLYGNKLFPKIEGSFPPVRKRKPYDRYEQRGHYDQIPKTGNAGKGLYVLSDSEREGVTGRRLSFRRAAADAGYSQGIDVRSQARSAR